MKRIAITAMIVCSSFFALSSSALAERGSTGPTKISSGKDSGEVSAAPTIKISPGASSYKSSLAYSSLKSEVTSLAQSAQNKKSVVAFQSAVRSLNVSLEKSLVEIRNASEKSGAEIRSASEKKALEQYETIFQEYKKLLADADSNYQKSYDSLVEKYQDLYRELDKKYGAKLGKNFARYTEKFAKVYKKQKKVGRTKSVVSKKKNLSKASKEKFSKVIAKLNDSYDELLNKANEELYDLDQEYLNAVSKETKAYDEKISKAQSAVQKEQDQAIRSLNQRTAKEVKAHKSLRAKSVDSLKKIDKNNAALGQKEKKAKVASGNVDPQGGGSIPAGGSSGSSGGSGGSSGGSGGSSGGSGGSSGGSGGSSGGSATNSNSERISAGSGAKKTALNICEEGKVVATHEVLVENIEKELPGLKEMKKEAENAANLARPPAKNKVIEKNEKKLKKIAEKIKKSLTPTDKKALGNIDISASSIKNNPEQLAEGIEGLIAIREMSVEASKKTTRETKATIKKELRTGGRSLELAYAQVNEQVNCSEAFTFPEDDGPMDDIARTLGLGVAVGGGTYTVYKYRSELGQALKALKNEKGAKNKIKAIRNIFTGQDAKALRRAAATRPPANPFTPEARRAISSSVLGDDFSYEKALRGRGLTPMAGPEGSARSQAAGQSIFGDDNFDRKNTLSLRSPDTNRSFSSKFFGSGTKTGKNSIVLTRAFKGAAKGIYGGACTLGNILTGLAKARKGNLAGAISSNARKAGKTSVDAIKGATC